MTYVFRRRRMRLAARLLDAVGSLVFGRVAPRKPQASPTFASALVVRLDHLGDQIHASAIAKNLKEHLGVRRVDVLTNSAGSAVLANNPYIDSVHLFEPSWYGRSRKKGESLFALAEKLKKERYDLAVLPRGDARENLLSYLIRAKTRVGYGITGGGFFLTHKLPYDRAASEKRHTEDLLRSLGIERPDLTPKIYFSNDEARILESLLHSFGLKAHAYGVIQIDAGNAAKDWPLDHWRSLLTVLSTRMKDQPLVFVGQSRERAAWLGELLRGFPETHWQNWVGKTSLRELFYLLRQARFFIGADSGPGHVAMSFGVPSLTLYSGTNRLEEWRQDLDHAFYLKNDVPCAPCRLTHCRVEGHPCMSGIRPEVVYGWMKERGYGL